MCLTALIKSKSITFKEPEQDTFEGAVCFALIQPIVCPDWIAVERGTIVCLQRRCLLLNTIYVVFILCSLNHMICRLFCLSLHPINILQPTANPSQSPSKSPSKEPSVSPSANPTKVPTGSPSKQVS